MLPCRSSRRMPTPTWSPLDVLVSCLGQRRDVGFDARRVDADVDEHLGVRAVHEQLGDDMPRPATARRDRSQVSLHGLRPRSG